MILAELLHGALKSARPDHNRHEMARFAAWLEVMASDADAAAHAVEIRASLQRRGQAIGGYDVLIAGHARSRSIVVVTGNLGAFTQIEGLRCEDWGG